MKTYHTSFAILLLLLIINPVQAVIWLQYNFDSQTRDDARSYFVDQSGNNLTLRFNRFVQEHSDYPFVSSHPHLQGIDKSGRTTYGSNATSGGVQGDFSYINLNQPNGPDDPLRNSFTMQGWVKPTAFVEGTSSHLFSLSSNVGGTSAFVLGYTDEGLVQARFYSRGGAGGDGEQWLITSHTLELNEWTHLAYIYDAATLRIYINGEEAISSVRGRALPVELTTISIAGSINGNFDDFQLVGGALAPEELGYHHPFTIPEPSTVAAFSGLLLLSGLLWRRRLRTVSN